MDGAPPTRSIGTVAALRRFARPAVAVERCDLCGLGLAPVHRHLLEMESRRINCACDGCALTFQNVTGGRFKVIPRDARRLDGMRLTDLQWESLALPIHLAFFLYSTPAGKMVALYPSPAGATESLLPLEAWAEIVAVNPVLAGLEPDVEALLVNRVGEEHAYFAAPIDVCFELAGLIRMHWRGLSGGDKVWREIDRFFTKLRENARPQPAAPRETQDA